MKIIPAGRIALGAVVLFASPRVRATDLRFDQSTSNNAVLLPNLSFPSANGHFNLIGGSTYKSLVESKGNTAAIYYNNFNASNPFSTYPNPHDMAVAIQSYVNANWSLGQNGWIALNEISSSNWQNNPVNVNGYDYHTWCIDVAALLKNGDSSDPSHVIPAHTGVIMWAPFATPSSANRSSWQALTQYAYIADEDYIDGATVQSGGYSVPKVQSFYQTSYNAWVNNAGVSPDRLILSEYYSNSLANNGYGANGTNGEAWQAAIETRALAAHNVVGAGGGGFGGYVGYSWANNAQGSSNATLLSYVNAYASTMVLQTEIPCWTGNNSSITGNSWADYLNWTGGLPSTTQFPYDPLLNNSYNVGVIQHQTAANFLSNANPSAGGTTITLDGNQSITTMTFDSPHSYTIAPGTGGSLTLTGRGAAVTVAQGAHTIAVPVQLQDDVNVSVAGGSLTISGSISGSKALAKSGAGPLVLSGSTISTSSLAGNGGTMQLAAGGDKLIKTGSFSVSGGGKIDLTDNQAIVSGGDLNAVTDLIAAGRNGGSWNGSGILSSLAPARNGLTTLGVAKAGDIGYGDTRTFGGQSVSATDVLVMYTYCGDANLDGLINGDDYFRIDNGFLAHLSGFSNGDFNYDGVINADDYFLIDRNYASQGTPFSSAAILGAVTTVPEPMSLGWFMVAMALTRRRRLKCQPQGGNRPLCDFTS